MTAQRLTTPLAPTIRLFDPADGNGPPIKPGPDADLRTCIVLLLLPELTKISETTRLDYFTLLNHWERLTNNPAIGRITKKQLETFQTRLAGGDELFPNEKRSPATVNKLFRVLSAVLRFLGPKDWTNKGGQGLIGYVVIPDRLTELPTIPRTASFDELDRLYAACSLQTWPRKKRFPASYFWRLILVLAYNYGPRTYDLLALHEDNIEWHWQDKGGFSFVAKKTNKLHRMPLNDVARKHLLPLRGCGEPIFPGFRRTNKKTVSKHWQILCDNAGIDKHIVIEDLRKTCNTAHEQHSHGVGQWILGHSCVGVNAKNYIDPTGIVLKAVNSLPQPTSFVSDIKLPRDRQLTLF